MGQLTEFQKKKIQRVFDMLYDSNHDGVIEKRDFDSLLAKISKILSWGEGTTKYNDARHTLDIVWKGLLSVADKNQDDMITLEEWEQMWASCLEDLKQDKLPDWQQRYMELMFDVNDKSGDNLIDLKEYTAFLSSFGVSEEGCREAFEKFSEGENINKDKFKTLWKNYITSNDETEKANYLFGPSFNKV